ncbi:MAG TPA: ABC transporter ATP-binding protein [Rickettsiales bacterium]|nr:ABC transporter ATP-binding protein [Rickettsiales bacterium]
MKNDHSPLKFIIHNCKPFRFLLSCHLFVVLFAAIDTSLWPYVSKLLIDVIAATNHENVIAKSTPIAILVIILVFLQAAIWRISDYAWAHLNPALKRKITTESACKIMQHSTSFFQNNFTGALGNRIKDLANATPRLIEISLYNFLNVFLILFIAFFTLLTVHKIFAFGLLTWAIIFIFIGAKAARMQEKLSANIADQGSRITGNIVDMLGNIANVKFFSNQRKERHRIEDLQDEYSYFSRKRGMFLLKFYAIHGLTFALYFAFCIIILIMLYDQNKVTIGDFALIFTINTWIIHAMWMAAGEMRGFLEEWGLVKQALQIIDEPIEIIDAPNAATLTVSTKGGEIIFKDVDFTYKIKNPKNNIKIADWTLVGAAEPKIDFIEKEVSEKAFFIKQNIHIKAGQKIGLVGHSGGGKSTFVNLILRQFDVDSGQILIDGQNIAKVSQTSLSQAIAVIPQDPSLFHRSLFENISYAKNDSSILEVIEAAKNAHAHDFIATLPQNYDSLVGERGVKLSGGQRQRIAIARAFLKNAPILILDEATSQLDSITENLIQKSLEKLMKNKTTIIVAHRLSTLQNVDRILVFDKGQIVEEGSHQELLAQKGIYKKMWDEQIGGFLQGV